MTTNRFHLRLFRPGSLLLLLLLLLPVACQSANTLKPIRPTVTPGGVIVGEPLLITFAELQAAPFTYLNQEIQVTGYYQRQAPPACRHERGPKIRWTLSEGEWTMLATNLETILRLVPDHFSLTVQGIWRRYEGPYGCGKKPSSSVVWYLQATRILYPNPLPNFSLATLPAPGSGGAPAPALSPSPPVSETPPAVTPGVISTATHTPTSAVIVSATATIAGQPTSPAAPTATPGLTAVVTPSPTVTISPTATATTVLPTLPAGTALPTATPTLAGYPGPPPPVPTATPGGYP
jgi:hypothetical protein